MPLADSSTGSIGVKKKRKLKRAAAGASSSTAPSVDSLLEQANAFVDEIPPRVDRAMELFEQAISLDSNSVAVLDAFGGLLCDQGDHPRATALLQRSVSLQPDRGYNKYFHLAQMVSGTDALKHYERGSQILLKQITSRPSKDVKRLMKLATVQASIAELYMTELCDESDAEEKCEAAIDRGLVADPNCLELLVAKMALRKVQGIIDESKELSLVCLKHIDEALSSSDPDTILPSDEVCIALCRAQIDLGLVDEARGLLRKLLAQDEEDIQVWYLLACSHLIEKEVAAVKECAQSGLEIVARAGGDADDWKQPLTDVLAQAAQLRSSGASTDAGAEGEEVEEGEAAS